MKQTLEKIFYLLLFLVTCYVQFGMAQDTVGTKYINTRPENMTLKDGRRLALVDEWWKYLQIVNQENVEQTYTVRRGSVGLFILIQPPDTVNTWEMDVVLRKRGVVTPPPQIVLKETVNDRDARIKYSTGWNESGVGASWATKFNNGDVKFTYQVGATASFDFTGKRLSVIAEECDNHSNVKIEILQGATVVKTASVNTYRSTGTAAMPASNANQCPAGVKAIIYTSDDLQQGNYTARVSLESVNLTTVPQRNSFVFDGFLVYE
jgi:hypothetical protein